MSITSQANATRSKPQACKVCGKMLSSGNRLLLFLFIVHVCIWTVFYIYFIIVFLSQQLLCAYEITLGNKTVCLYGEYVWSNAYCIFFFNHLLKLLKFEVLIKREMVVSINKYHKNLLLLTQCCDCVFSLWSNFLNSLNVICVCLFLLLVKTKQVCDAAFCRKPYLEVHMVSWQFLSLKMRFIF